MSQKRLETTLMQSLGEQTKRIMVFSKVAYKLISIASWQGLIEISFISRRFPLLHKNWFYIHFFIIPFL